MRNKVFFLATILMAVALCAPAFAELNGKQIVEKSKEAQQGAGSVNKVKMTLINKRGDKLEQKIVTRARTVNGLNQQVTTFLYPDETKGTKFLMTENAGRDDDMRIFIPDLKRVRTISSSQRNQSYMGSDFAYGDLEALEPEKGEHKLVGSESVEGQDCHLVETTLDPKQGVGYSKLRNWIRKDNFIPIKTEYYDKDGELKKIKSVHDLYQDGNVWVLKKMVMKDVQRNHRTIIEIVESKQSKIEDSFFTEQFLRQTDKF